MGKIKFRDLVKTLEFLAVIGATSLGLFFGGVSLFWAIMIGGSYILINVLGLATKPTQDVIDDIKDEVEEIKERRDKEREGKQ